MDRSMCLSPTSIISPPMMEGSTFCSNLSVFPDPMLAWQAAVTSASSFAVRGSADVTAAGTSPLDAIMISEKSLATFSVSGRRPLDAMTPNRCLVVSVNFISVMRAMMDSDFFFLGTLGSERKLLKVGLVLHITAICAISLSTLSRDLAFTAAEYRAPVYRAASPYCFTGGATNSDAAASEKARIAEGALLDATMVRALRPKAVATCLNIAECVFCGRRF
mmetsp:Transcript_8226/g.16945  ORF Transcript_8226/g.16945 Transcript_8226/m.16945 type:complete len:220 (+) Transcript_8226:213-872(+)